ncbi:hypothetical protein NQ317_014088 [Molorchus minor]|uniref:P21-activated protein kinase-interacting protein 1-like n=1 Tax=Molorchus minor TaxID=1323400 RepID=A0ABQ9JG79_9CUCU|nr:hypothetical protein NQ317_014088 [Molorchus minor]
MLTHHNATINCLKFTPNHSHLISGSADGVLAIVRVGNWQLEKVWEKAHKGSAILDIAVHPSGKLALTLGSDCSLRTWNLIKGRQAYIINLNSKSKDARSLDKIIWAEDGIRFVLFGGRYTEIWSIESGGIIKSIEHNITINDDNKHIQQAHEARVKALAKFNKWVISASSGGEIKVWTKDLQELAKQDSSCRIHVRRSYAFLKGNKEESEDILEVVEEQTLTNTVKKSSVVVEIEGSDNENAIFDEPDKKTLRRWLFPLEKKIRKHKLGRNQEIESNKGRKKKQKQTTL